MPQPPDTTRQDELRQLLGGFAPVHFRIAARQPVETGWPGVHVERLTLESPDGPIRAILTGPAGPWRDLPAVLYCHAHGNRYHVGASELTEGRPALLQPPYGRALAEAGIVALCIDLPCFGERTNLLEPALAKAYLWRGQTLFGAMLAELSGALTLLRSMEGIDPGRIGVMGLSMGATLSFWLSALEAEIRAIAHLCCFADLACLIDSGAHDLHGIYMTVPGLVSRFTTGEIAGMSAPRPQLVCVGTYDSLTPPAAIHKGVTDARQAYAAAGANDSLEVLVAQGSGHVETPAMREAVLRFFREKL